MKNLTIENIVKSVGGEYRGSRELLTREVEGVVLDSRKIEPGYCFVATKGERVDGHSFIGQVIEKGCIAVICEDLPEDCDSNQLYSKAVLIQVNDSFEALKKTAEFYRMQLDIPIIGITGSVGKTSTKEYIAGTLGAKFNVLKTQGNFNNEIGVPLTILSIRDEHEIAVIEMGINHFGEMNRLSRIVKPNAVVMTNIGECHLEFLGSLEGVLQAKSEIFDYISEDGDTFVNGDDALLRTIEKVRHKVPVTFGLDTRNTYYAKDVTDRGLGGSKATFVLPDKTELEVSVNQPGDHNVRNALVGCAVAKRFGLSDEEIVRGIASVKPVNGRSNIIEKSEITIIDDCYNANPVSVRAALDLLSLAQGRKIAILGDMFELGKDENILHEEIGKYAIRKNIENLICIGELSKKMYKAACSEKIRQMSNTHVQYYETVDEMLKEMLTNGRAGVPITVLVKASHGMNFSKIVDTLCFQADKHQTYRAFYE